MKKHTIEGMLIFDSLCLKKSAIVSLRVSSSTGKHKVILKDCTGEQHIMIGQDAIDIYKLFTGENLNVDTE